MMRISLNTWVWAFLIGTAVSGCQESAFEVPDESGVFIKIFGTYRDDEIFGLTESSDRDIYVVGHTPQDSTQNLVAFIVKADRNGNQEWNRQFDSLKATKGAGIAITQDGQTLVLGHANNADNANTDDFSVAMVNSPDNEPQVYQFGTDSLNEEGRFLAPARNEGEFILVGPAFPRNNLNDQDEENPHNIFISKINAQGERIAAVISGQQDEIDQIRGIAETIDGDFVWCGTTTRNGQKDLRVAAVNIFGASIFDFDYGKFLANTAQSTARGMVVEVDGYVLAGYTFTNDNETDATPLLFKVDLNGGFQWVTQLDESNIGATSRKVEAITPTNDGGYAMVGTATVRGQDDIYLVKTDRNRNILWERTFGHEEEPDRGRAIIQTRDGRLLLVGNITINNNLVMALIKTDENGITVGRAE